MHDIPTDFTKIQVVLYLGFDEESDKALQVAWEVAQELLKEGIWVELIPDHVWFSDLLGTGFSELPKIAINGWIAVIGRAPDPDELRELILAVAHDLGHPRSRGNIAALTT